MTERQRDDVQNAVLAGMALADAYVYAGVGADEIARLEEDAEWQGVIAKRTRQLEYGLLNKLHAIIDVQVDDGKDSAVTWALEHMFPRYAGKAQAEGQPIHIHFDSLDPANDPHTEIHR